jgi:hypothetical protein
LLSYLLLFPDVQVALVKRLAGSQRAEVINLPTLTKVLLQGSTRIIYIDGLLSRKAVPKPLLSYFYSRTFNCTSKTTGWFTKGLKLIEPHANKVLLKVAHSYILMDFFQSRKLAQADLTTTFAVPAICTSENDWLGSPKGQLTCPTLTKVLLK